jgi:drug/metabolite transporter (DMT)-like permease
MTALLALVSAVLVGGADFVGGIASRTANGVRVAAFAQVVGLAFAVPVSIAYGADRLGASDVSWSVLSGMAVGGGFGLFYTAMGRGLISVVAPVAAVTGAVLPVVYALARGERPGTTAVVGLAIALVAVAIVSMAPAEQHADAGVVDGIVIGLSIGSGLFFGTFYIAFSQISDDAGLWPVTLERVAAASVLVVLAVTLTHGPIEGVRRLLPYALAIGALEVAATVPLLLALQRGPVAVASVLASLYPVTTVILAGSVLHERLSRLQYVGVVLALAAVALVSTGS